MNEIKIKSIRKLNKIEYENKFKYSINVENNHNYFLNNGILSKNCVAIIDETQNIDLHTFKTIITRIGNNSKFIFLGDTEQIDRKIKNESCFSKICDMFKDSEFVGVVNFSEEDCVRNPIIPKVLDVFAKNNL